MVAVTTNVGRNGKEPGAANVLKLGRAFRYGVLGLVGIFFIIPILASARFSFLGNNNTITISAYTELFSTPQFWSTLFLSVKIGLGTVLLTLALLIPTVVWIHLRVPKLKRVFESISLLPLVIPSVVVTLGVITSFKSLPNIIMGTPVILALEYVILALPYSYRTFDSAVQAIDLKTLVDAGQSLGAGWSKLLRLVLLPNLRSGLLGAAILAFAFCLGEFAVASLLSFTTFPVFLVQVGQVAASQAVALSLIARLFTWMPLAVIIISFGQRNASSKKKTVSLAKTIEQEETTGIA
ncbi:MAG: ABC transporter permease subunit [Acidimicrobiaceae bacterium]|nr:ABC transporter permease subunit [Acidimicrobiaceae bacterium]